MRPRLSPVREHGYPIHWEVRMEMGSFPTCHLVSGPLALGFSLLLLSQGCATPSEGMLPESSTPVVTRVQGPGGGDVYLTSEL